MGDRGSKSKYWYIRPGFVKEQRVDGNYCIKAKTKNAIKVYSNGFRKKISSQNPY